MTITVVKYFGSIMYIDKKSDAPKPTARGRDSGGTHDDETGESKEAATKYNE